MTTAPCSLEIFALFMLTGIFSTLLLPETMGRCEFVRISLSQTLCAETELPCID